MSTLAERADQYQLLIPKLLRAEQDYAHEQKNLGANQAAKRRIEEKTVDKLPLLHLISYKLAHPFLWFPGRYSYTDDIEAEIRMREDLCLTHEATWDILYRQATRLFQRGVPGSYPLDLNQGIHRKDIYAHRSQWEIPTLRAIAGSVAPSVSVTFRGSSFAYKVDDGPSRVVVSTNERDPYRLVLKRGELIPFTFWFSPEKERVFWTPQEIEDVDDFDDPRFLDGSVIRANSTK